MLVARRRASLLCEGGTSAGTSRACFSAFESFLIRSQRTRPVRLSYERSSTLLCNFVHRTLEVVEFPRLERPPRKRPQILGALQLLSRPHPDLDVVVERMAHLLERSDRRQEARELQRPQ